MITEIQGQCKDRNCRNPATQIAAGKDAEPRVYCDGHAEEISQRGSTVLVEDCPNCHCSFGVWP